MFVWLTNSTLPLAGLDATQPTLRLLSSITFDTLNTINESSYERTVSLRSALHTLLHLHLRHYLSNTIFQERNVYFNNTSTTINVSFRWIRQELE